MFSIFGVHEGIFSSVRSLNAMGAGWLILAMVDVSDMHVFSCHSLTERHRILPAHVDDLPNGCLSTHIAQIIWVLYFTAEDGSLVLHIFDSFGGGVPMNRRGPRRRAPSGVVDYNSGAYGDVGTGYRGGGISNTDVGVNFGSGPGGPIASQHSLGQKSPGLAGPGPIGMSQAVHSTPSVTGMAGIQPQHTGASAQTGAGGSIGGPLGMPIASPPPPDSVTTATDSMPVRAKALYACELLYCESHGNVSLCATLDQASPDDPNEISFGKGEILEIMDKQGLLIACHACAR